MVLAITQRKTYNQCLLVCEVINFKNTVCARLEFIASGKVIASAVPFPKTALCIYFLISI